MKKIILQVLSIQLFAQANSRGNVAALITKTSEANPSKNGVHEINEGQLRRIVTRSLGVFNPIGFKHMIEMCNGSAKLSIDATECVTGEAYEKSNGEKGTYTKDWTKYSNHEVSFGIVGSQMLVKLSLQSSFEQAAQSYAPTFAPKKAEVAVEAEAKGEVDKKEEVVIP